MDLSTYKKKIIPLIVIGLFFNISLLFILHYLRQEGLGKIYWVLLILNVLFNVILSFNKTFSERHKYLYGENKGLSYVFFIIILFNMPLVGLFFLYESFQDKEQNSQTLKTVLLKKVVPLSLISLLLIPLSFAVKEKSYLISRSLNVFSPPIENYTFNVAYEAEKIFNLKDNIGTLCPNEFTRVDCALNIIKEKHHKFPLGQTEMILSVAFLHMELFKYKKLIPKTNGNKFLIINKLYDMNFDLLNISCSIGHPLNIYSGSPLNMALGNVELSLLEIVEAQIQKLFMETALEAFSKYPQQIQNAPPELISRFRKMDDIKKSGCYKVTQYAN